jgi:ferredoxin
MVDFFIKVQVCNICYNLNRSIITICVKKNIENKKMKRDIIKIDEDLCNGCGLCVPNCHEGALQVIDGKVRLISDLMCDGLGACTGHCPEGAITIETREAEPYNETGVMKQMINKGRNTVVAHLKHLKEHDESEYLKEGVRYLREHISDINFDLDGALAEVHTQEGILAASTAAPIIARQINNESHAHAGAHTQLHPHSHSPSGGCPGSRAMVIERQPGSYEQPEYSQSELRQWPIQMHLVNPNAPYFKNADILLAADCVAYSIGGFHSRFLKGRSLAIACPKLDHNTDIYIEKLKILVDDAKVNTITVMMMEVPCCGALLQMVRSAVKETSRKVPVKMMITGISGEILQEEWI